MVQGGGSEEVQQAEEVFQAAAEGGAGDAPAVAGRQLAGHLGCLGRGRLHHLSLVQADAPPAQPGQGGGYDLQPHQDAEARSGGAGISGQGPGEHINQAALHLHSKMRCLGIGGGEGGPTLEGVWYQYYCQ